MHLHSFEIVYSGIVTQPNLSSHPVCARSLPLSPSARVDFILSVVQRGLELRGYQPLDHWVVTTMPAGHVTVLSEIMRNCKLRESALATGQLTGRFGTALSGPL